MKYGEIENNIKNFESHMTIYFNKKTEKIVSWCTGLNNMDFFNDIDSELREIWDYEIFPLDEYVIENRELFIVKNGELRLLPKPKPKPKYKYATEEDSE